MSMKIRIGCDGCGKEASEARMTIAKLRLLLSQQGWTSSYAGSARLDHCPDCSYRRAMYGASTNAVWGRVPQPRDEEPTKPEGPAVRWPGDTGKGPKRPP